MSAEVKYPVVVAAVFLWIGFVGAISFMEAWLKFRAPGVTLPVGLSIGRLVFSILNKVEWVFAFAIGINLLWSDDLLSASANPVFICMAVVLLLLQTMWLLPRLDAKAEMHIRGQAVSRSYVHVYYVAAEVLKILMLFIFGIKLL